MKKILSILCLLSLVLPLAACGEKQAEAYPDAHILSLSGHEATLDGKAAEAFDYVWCIDPSVSHDEDEDAPAEYHEGEKPATDDAVFIDSDLPYFPSLPEDSFRLIKYDGEQEWAACYSDGVHDDYIFATLPHLGSELPSDMMHTAEEAAENRVLHIQAAGTYRLTGEWKGQILVDLGKDAADDPEAKVTLILNGADITCSVAPAIVFRNVYECDGDWAERTEYSPEVDSTEAGAVVILAKGSTNTVSGTNIFRMLKPIYKDEDATDAVKVQKKLRKLDGAFYSYVTMNIEGEGALTVNAGFEGIDSELHLSFLGGDITVNSGDDGINVNEDHVSVVRFLGGKVTLNPAEGAEGDGVDSNGYIYINGGELAVNGVVPPDNALDSEDGILYQKGKVFVDGKEQTLEPGQTVKEVGGGMGGRPGETVAPPPGMAEIPPQPADQPMGNFDLDDFKEKVAGLDEDATIDDVLAILGMGAPTPQK